MSNATVATQGCGTDTHANKALTVEEARQRIMAAVEPVAGVEKIALRSALGRILAEDILSPIDVPSHTNSAVDGYALISAGLSAEAKKLHVIGTSWAGRPFSDHVQAGECVRIMTGAVVPHGADAVIMQEQVQVQGDTIEFAADIQPGDNVRAAGEDLAKGQLALARGKHRILG